MVRSLSLLRPYVYLALLAAAFAGSAPRAQAVNYYWDTNGTAAGSGAPTGTWGTSAFWSTSSVGTATPTAVTTSNIDDIFFSAGTNGTTGTVTVTGTQLASSITLSNNVAITISGGTALTIGGTGTNQGIFVAAGNNAANTISTAVNFSTAAFISNSGTGTLTFGSNPLGFSTNTITIGTGNGAIVIGSATAASARLTGTGTLIKTGTGTLTLSTIGGTAAIASAMPISVQAGTLQVTTSNAAATTAMLGTGAITLTPGATINYSTGNTTASTITNTISIVNSTGTATLSTATGAFTHSGAVSFAAGANNPILRITNSNGTASTWTMSGGITGPGSIQLNPTAGGSAITLSGTAVNNTGTISNVGASTSTATISAAVGANVVSISQAGANPFTVSGAITLNATNSTFNSTGAGLWTLSGGFGTNAFPLVFNANAAGGITVATAAVNNAGTITNSGTGNGTTTISAAIGANATNLSQNSATSQLILSGTNLYTGTTAATAGFLSFTTTLAIPGYSTSPATAFGSFASPRITAASGTTVAMPYGAASNAVTTTDITGFLNGTYGIFAAGSSLGIDTTNANPNPADLSSVAITDTTVGSLGFTKMGANALTVNIANTYTGATRIVNGTLNASVIGNVGAASGSLGAPTTIPNGTISLGFTTNTGILSYTGTGETTDRVINLAGSTGGGGIDNSGTGVLTISSAFTFTGAGVKTLTLSGASDIVFGSTLGTNGVGTPAALTLAKTGTNTALLNGTLTTITTLNISGGILDIGASGLAISNTGGNVIAATGNATINATGGGILTLSSNSATDGGNFGAASGFTLTVNANINTSGTGGTLELFNAANSTGVVVLTGTNTYTGTTIINSGVLSVSNLANNLGSGTTINLGNGTSTGNTLRYTGLGETSNRIINLSATTGAGILEQSGPSGNLLFTSAFTATGAGIKVLTLQGSTAGTGEIGGAIVNSTATTGITKAGTGTWTLSGANTYTGPTTVGAGNLVLSLGSGSGVLGNTAITVNAGGTLSPLAGFVAGNNLTAAAGATLILNAGGIVNLADGTIGNFTLTQNATFATAGAQYNGGTIILDVSGTASDSIISGGSTLGSTATGTNAIVINPISGFAPGGPYTIIAGGAGTGSFNANFFLASSTINVGGSPYSLALSQSGTNEQLTITAGVSAAAPGIAYWNGTINSSWNTQPGGAGTATNWVVTATGSMDTFSLPGGGATGTNVIVSSNTVGAGGLNTTLDAAFNINSLTFTGTATANTAGSTIATGTGGAASTLTINAAAVNGNALGNGITVLAGSGANTINANVILGASQTWTNNATNNLTIGGIVSESSAGFGLTKAGTGTIVLNGLNTYTGATTINAGILSVATLAAGGSPSNIGQSTNAATNLVFGTSTLQYTGGTQVTDRNFTINAGATATIEVATSNAKLTLAGHSGAATSGVLTKTGAGILNLSGVNANTGNTNVNGGTLSFSGSATLSSAKLLVGFGGTSGAVIFDSSATMSISPGSGADFVSLGGGGGYGYMRNNGGAITLGQLGLSGSVAGTNNTGVFEQNGGTTTMGTVAGYVLTGWTGTNSNGILNVLNGTFRNNSTVQDTQMGFAASLNSFGMFNVIGATSLFDTTGNGTNTVRIVDLAKTAGNFAGVVNLNSGGTLAAVAVRAANATTPTFLNFNSGILRAGVATTTFVSGLTRTTVYGGGATIDSNGFAVTIPQALAAPSGQGIDTISVANAGAGYFGAPAVRITGGGGTGATAIAAVDLDPTSATYGQITGFTITSPGNDYTSAPTISLIGGGATTQAVAGTPTLAANAISGGLTKIGDGTLTLSGANTYAGGTTINVGTLALGANNALLNTGNVTINGTTATFNVATFNNTVGTVTLQNGSIAGSTGVLTSNDFQLRSGSVGAILAGTGTVTKTTAGTVTLSGANIFTGAISVNGGLVAFATSPATAGPLGNNTAINLNGGGISYTGAGTNALNKVVAIGSGDGTINVASSTGLLTIATATSTGGNLIKTGPGTAQIAGTTTLNAGVVVSGGTLNAGFGTAGITTLTVSSGNMNFTNSTIEALTLSNSAGALNLSGTSQLGFELDGATNDRVTVATGGTAVTGGTVTLNFFNFGAGVSPGTYTLLTADGGLGGASYVLGTAPNGFNYTINVSSTVVSLTTNAFTPIFWNNTQGDSSWSTVAPGTNFTTLIGGTIDAGHVPLATETVIFNTNNIVGPAITTTLDGSFTIDSLQFNGAGTPAATSVTINAGTGGTLTLKPLSSSGGILISAAGVNATISAALVLDNTFSTGQTWNVSDAASTLLISGNTTFGANVTKTGLGTLTLGGNNGGAGAITLSAGLLNINSATALGTGTLTIAAGTTIDSTVGVALTTANTQNWNGSFTFTGTQDLNLGTGAVTLANSPTVTTATANRILTVGGAIGGSGNSLTKTGPGTLVLNGNNSYTGLTTVAAGTLTLGGANTGAGGVTLSVGLLNINNAGALGTGTFTIATGTTIDNTSGAAIPTSTNNNVQNWNGSFIFTGSNSLNLGTGTVTIAANPTLTLAGSTLTVGGNISGASNLTTAGAGNLVLGGNFTQTGAVTFGNTGTVTVNGNFAHIGNTTVNSGTVVFNGNLSHNGATTITGGTVTMNGTGTYTGLTTISGGVLRLGSATALPTTGAVTMSGTSTLDLFGNSGTIGAFTTVATSTVTNSSSSISASTATTPGTPSGTGIYVDALTVAPATAAVVPALITDGATRKTQIILTNANAATQVTGNAANTYSGGLVLANSTGGTRLAVGATITGTPWGSGPIIIGQAATDKAGIYFANAITMASPIVFNTALGTDRVGIRADAAVTLSGVITANLAPATFSSNTAVGTVTLTNRVTGTFGLVLDIVSLASATTAFTVTLNNSTANPNNYEGDTVVNFNATAAKSATLVLGQANQIPNGTGTGNVVLNTNGTGIGLLSLGGFNETINGLSGNGTLDGATTGTPANTLTLGDNNATATFSGLIRNTVGTLALTKIGTGTQTLSGANTFTGATVVSAGILNLTNSLALQNSPLDTLGSILGDVANGFQTGVPTLTFGGLTGDKDLATVFATGGNYNTVTGVTVNPGTGATLAYTGIIANGAAFTTLTKTGAGTQTLSGASTYTGPTILNAGVLSVPTLANGGLASTIGQSSNAAANLVFGGTGTLQYTGSSITIDRNFTINAGSTATFDITQAGTTLELPGATGAVTTGNLTKVGLGTLSLSGVNTYTGTTTIGNGTLRYTAANQTLGGLTFGLTNGGTTAGSLDLSTAGVTFGSLTVQTNLVAANTINLGANTLTINGNVLVGTSAGTNPSTVNTNLNVNGTAGSAVVVNLGAAGTFRTGNFTAGTNVNGRSLVDFSSVDAVTIIGGATSALTVASQGDNSATGVNTLRLGAVANTVTVNTLTIGGSSMGAVQSLSLGAGTNAVNTNTLVLGSGSRDTGVLNFTGANGSVTLRNLAGTGRSNVTLGVSGTQTTAYTTANLIDLTGHAADVAIGTLTTSPGAKTAANTNELRFSTGTLDILSINMALVKGAGASTNKITIAGGTTRLGGSTAFADSGTGSITLATAGSGELAITGGTVISTVNILRGAATAGSAAILTLNGGTLDLNGNTIGSATAIDILNFQSGTLRNVAEINNGGAIAKTTAGTLILEGTNTYTGITTIGAGILQVGSGSTTGTLGTGNITNDSVLAFNRSNSYTVANIIGGTGVVNQNGTGTTIITGANTYTGNTNVNAGELRVDTPGSIGSNTAIVTVASGATLSGTGTVIGPVTVQTGGTLRGDSGTGTGTLTFGAATPASTSTITGGTTGATLATYLPASPTLTITGNSLIDIGANTLNLDSTLGKFNIRLLNDGGLANGQPHSITLATSTAGTFNRNGTPYDAGTNAFNSLTDFTVVSGSGSYTYDPNMYTLSVQSNNLVLNFIPTAVPEPATVLGLAVAGMGLAGWVRRRRNARVNG